MNKQLRELLHLAQVSPVHILMTKKGFQLTFDNGNTVAIGHKPGADRAIVKFLRARAGLSGASKGYSK